MKVDGSRLGIDFGTSSTVAVLGGPDNRAAPLMFAETPVLPSAVCRSPTGELLVGRDAMHASKAWADAFEPNPKARIDDGDVLLGSAVVPVVDLVAAVLRRVHEEARRTAGGDIESVTLTCPAMWGSRRRAVLTHAAAVAGLPTPLLVPEPVAAAAYFVRTLGRDLPTGRYVVIYDFGAGTFDASVVRRTDDGFTVLAEAGLSDAGGVDLDAQILAYFGAIYGTHKPAAWQTLTRPETLADRRTARNLWDDVRSAKEMLSRSASAIVHLPLLDVDAMLNREQLEQLARPLLDRTVAATQLVIRTAGIDRKAIAGVFLVGGSSRMPLAATMLHRALDIAPTAIEQPELVVAAGSLQASGPSIIEPRPPLTTTQHAQPPVGQPQPYLPSERPERPLANRSRPPERHAGSSPGIVVTHTESRTETASRPSVIDSEPLVSGSVSERRWDADVEPATAAVLTGWQRLSALSGVLLAAWCLGAGTLAWSARGVDRRSGFPDYFYAGPAITAYLMVGFTAVVLVAGTVELWWLARYGPAYWALTPFVLATLSSVAVAATFVIAQAVGADHPWTFGWLLALQAIWLTAILNVAWTAIVLARTYRVRKVALRRRWLTDTATSGPEADLRSTLESLTVIPSVRIAQVDEGPLTAVVFAGRRVALIGVVTWGGGVYATRTWEGDLVRNGVSDTIGSESIGTLHEQARRWRRRLHRASVRTFVLIRSLDEAPLQVPSASNESFITYVTAQTFVETVGRFLSDQAYVIDINTVWRILRHLPAASVASLWPNANESRGNTTGVPTADRPSRQE